MRVLIQLGDTSNAGAGRLNSPFTTELCRKWRIRNGKAASRPPNGFGAGLRLGVTCTATGRDTAIKWIVSKCSVTPSLGPKPASEPFGRVVLPRCGLTLFRYNPSR
jgi:hypothetical protein